MKRVMPMMRMRLAMGALALVLVAGMAGAMTSAEEDQSLRQWRQERLDELTGETGWLSLVGLYWLDAAVNSVGRGARNTIDISYPLLGRHAGDFVVDPTGVTFVPARGSCLGAAGGSRGPAVMRADVTGNPTVLSCGSLRVQVIQRAGRYAIRVRDIASRARTAFHGIASFPADVDWVIDARFEAYEPVRHVGIVNVLGMDLDMVSPGAVVFTREGREWRLDALLESPTAPQLFLMFTDGTSGRETYGGGRFLYAPLPVNGRVQVDFNRAHSPPCAFTAFATCPLPPSQNRLALRIEAGEKFSGHLSPGVELR